MSNYEIEIIFLTTTKPQNFPAAFIHVNLNNALNIFQCFPQCFQYQMFANLRKTLTHFQYYLLQIFQFILKTIYWLILFIKYVMRSLNLPNLIYNTFFVWVTAVTKRFNCFLFLFFFLLSLIHSLCYCEMTLKLCFVDYHVPQGVGGTCL